MAVEVPRMNRFLGDGRMEKSVLLSIEEEQTEEA